MYCTTATRLSTQLQLTNISKGRVVAQAFSTEFNPVQIRLGQKLVEWISLWKVRISLRIILLRLHTHCESTVLILSAYEQPVI